MTMNKYSMTMNDFSCEGITFPLVGIRVCRLWGKRKSICEGKMLNPSELLR